MKKRKIFYHGWMSVFLRYQLGNHPVFQFTKYPPDGYYIERLPNVKSRGVAAFFKNRVVRLNALFCIVRYSIKFLLNGVRFRYIKRFWKSREIKWQEIERIIPGRDTIAIYPSALFFIPNHSWIVEIEDMFTPMLPHINHGSLISLDKSSRQIIKIMEVLFMEKECVGILSHLDSTAEGLRTLFKDSLGVAEKISSIPLGRKVGNFPARARKNNNEKVNILFMSGWSQDPSALARRGLIDALEAFNIVSSKKPNNVTLRLRCPIPNDLSRRHLDMIYDNPEIYILDKKLPIEEIDNLYGSSDILLFPAIRLAVTTLLQAMNHSCAIVTADGFGIDEYVKHGVNGLVAKGWSGKSGYFDSDGMFQEDYKLANFPNKDVYTQAAQHIIQLVEDRDMLLRYQLASLDVLKEEFSIENWNKKFKGVLDKAVILSCR
ncbi:MAG: hypothetical protein KGP29_00825 [Proteobacteria bacterium]|nr:hypothetical protein [Pseudomonadota bacterium]